MFFLPQLVHCISFNSTGPYQTGPFWYFYLFTSFFEVKSMHFLLINIYIYAQRNKTWIGECFRSLKTPKRNSWGQLQMVELKIIDFGYWWKKLKNQLIINKNRKHASSPFVFVKLGNLLRSWLTNKMRSWIKSNFFDDSMEHSSYSIISWKCILVFFVGNNII